MQQPQPQLDPAFTNARREAFFILGLFACCFVWALGVYFADGYFPTSSVPGEIPTVLGMPRWVFWGIFLPWLVVDAVTIWFVFFFMRDDDLGEQDDKVSG